jgi:hypothetical protein
MINTPGKERANRLILRPWSYSPHDIGIDTDRKRASRDVSAEKGHLSHYALALLLDEAYLKLM